MTDVMSKLRRDAQVDAMLERVAVWSPRPDWLPRRECAGQPLEWWYDGGRACKGRLVCEACPVRMDCLTATIREERDAPALDDIAGHRAVSAHARRIYLSNERRAT